MLSKPTSSKTDTGLFTNDITICEDCILASKFFLIFALRLGLFGPHWSARTFSPIFAVMMLSKIKPAVL